MSPIEADLHGRVAVVTGSTAGIGVETAFELARLGATVVIVARSSDRAAQARAALVARGVPEDRLQTGIADLSSVLQVARLGAELRERFPRLDILVNNAGCYPAGRVITPEGFEESWATNVLAYDALTTQLEEPLRRAQGRLVFVASSMAGGLDFDDLRWQRRWWSGARAYMASKQADRMLGWAWERRLEGSGVAVNVAHPDGTATSIADRQRGLWGMIARAAFRTQRTPAEGADTSVWLAAAPETAASTGGFYVRREPIGCKYRADPDACDHLHELTQEQIAPYLDRANRSSSDR
jgi:NAD(P)-dependent dehydrogenase (short-subunit alcohol dehydrogenase family)